MNVTDRFDARLDLVPESPGVYLMKDTTGSVIYVGKAIRLKSRLRSYFTTSPKGMPKVMAMISNIADFSFIVCSNETEALLFECNLIKQFMPRYNVLLTDDKEYPYIKITYNEPYPKVLRAYHLGDDSKSGAKYYGPYLGGTLRKALETLKEIFPVRNCNLRLPEDIGKKRPCLNYFIGKCPAPCFEYISQEDYMKQVNGIRLFLEGKYDAVMRQLEEFMKSASEATDYEKAAIFRDRLLTLRQLMEKQTVSSLGNKDIDVIGFYTNPAESCVQKLEVRQGRIVGNSTFFSEGEDNPPEILENVLMQHYNETAYIPSEILIPFDIPDCENFQAALSRLKESSVKVRCPGRGKGMELMDMANKNAEHALRRRTIMAGSTSYAAKAALEKLSELLFGDVDKLKRVEAFDISNYGSEDISASMVVFVDGRPLRSAYRLFKIRNQEMQDDYAAMKQALQRRFAKAEDEKFGLMPQLVFVDGGLGHVGVACSVLTEMGIRDVFVLGLVKDNRHRTRALMFVDGRTIELSGDEETEGLLYEDKRSLLRLATAIQDEAHRFAAKYSGKLSQKRQIKFSLESIPGIGPSRRKALLKYFGTIRSVKDAGIEELVKVEGISSEIAKSIYLHFHEEGEITGGAEQ